MKAIVNATGYIVDVIRNSAFDKNVYDYLNPEDQERVESFRKAMEE